MQTYKGNVLVADDDRDSCKLLTLLLEKEGHTVETATDGRQTLERLKKGGVDLLLLDLMMPLIDGYQVLRVMNLDSNLRQIPVIVITAVGKKGSVQHCISLGAVDYLLKPFDPEVVRSRVAVVIMSKRLQEIENSLAAQVQAQKLRADELLNMVIPRGLALVNEADLNNLLDCFLMQTMTYCSADAGIVYLRSEEVLRFEVVRNKPLKISLGGISGKPCPYPPVHIMSDSTGGEPNSDLAVAVTAYHATPLRVNVDADADRNKISYLTTRFFDVADTFRAATFLYAPLINSSFKVVGVVELINARDANRGFATPFSEHQEMIIAVWGRFMADALEVIRLRKQVGLLPKSKLV